MVGLQKLHKEWEILFKTSRAEQLQLQGPAHSVHFTRLWLKTAASAEWTVTEGVPLAFSTEKLTLPSVSFLKSQKSGAEKVKIYFDSLTNPRLTCATPHQSVLSKKHIEYRDWISYTVLCARGRLSLSEFRPRRQSNLDT